MQEVLPGSRRRPAGPDAGWDFESAAWAAGFAAVAGIDEVGRGALAGPVVAAAVVFPPGTAMAGLRDSKRLSPARREALAVQIHRVAAGVALAHVGPQEIDRRNVLEATLLAMAQAVASVEADYLLLDAVRLPGWRGPQRGIIRGDGVCASIAAASVVAKVERDRLMVELDQTYPYYGFGANKGYGTPRHLEALRRFGPCPIHRRTFLPVRAGTPEGSLFEAPGEGANLPGHRRRGRPGGGPGPSRSTTP